MRYADGGGQSPQARQRREQVRREAAALFASGKHPTEVAARLEVSTKSSYAWRRAWIAGGADALASKGSSGPSPRLTVGQLARLEARLDEGPAAAGYREDQRWTLARVAKLIAGMFHQQFSLKGVSLVLRRMGWSPQMPTHRAAERDDEAVAHWRRHQWPAIKESRAGWARGSASPTSPASR